MNCLSIDSVLRWQTSGLHASALVDGDNQRRHWNNTVVVTAEEPRMSTAVPCPELNAQQFQAVDDPEVPVDALTLDKVRAAIKKLKFGCAAGWDAIPPEMLKLATDPTSCIIHQMFASVWATGKVPCTWKEGIIISLYKGKGPRNECASYRPITLLSVPGKVFAHAE